MAEKENVQDYYGKQLKSTSDLVTTSVNKCARKTVKLPPFIKDALVLVHPDILNKSYGCSTAYPEILKNIRILDLGCGCGRDCFVLSNVVGEGGRVVGLDMTDQLLKMASDKIDYHTKKYGYANPNVEFVKGFMEKLDEAGLEDNYFDVIVSNCVISLCRDKRAVIREAHRVLKPGGELYFSDLYRNGQLPVEVMEDKQMWCEGLIGSLTYRDLHDLAGELGFTAPRLLRADSMPVLDEDTKRKLGDVTYASVTYRLFKKAKDDTYMPPVEVTYKGGIQGYEETLEFDHRLTFKANQPKAVGDEVGLILRTSRFSHYFDSRPTEADTEEQVDVDPFELINEKQCKP